MPIEKNLERENNTYEYNDTCTFFTSPIIKVGFMITPFGGYACGWLKMSILRDGMASINYTYYCLLTSFFSDGRNKKNYKYHRNRTYCQRVYDGI